MEKKYKQLSLEERALIQAVNGKARIVQDDLQNTYDTCFEELGRKACSFTP